MYIEFALGLVKKYVRAYFLHCERSIDALFERSYIFFNRRNIIQSESL